MTSFISFSFWVPKSSVVHQSIGNAFEVFLAGVVLSSQFELCSNGARKISSNLETKIHNSTTTFTLQMMGTYFTKKVSCWKVLDFLKKKFSFSLGYFVHVFSTVQGVRLEITQLKGCSLETVHLVFFNMGSKVHHFLTIAFYFEIFSTRTPCKILSSFSCSCTIFSLKSTLKYCRQENRSVQNCGTFLKIQENYFSLKLGNNKLNSSQTQCGNFIILLSVRFYVKSILKILEVQNLPF